MGYAPVMLISLSWNTRKQRYPGPACACHALPKSSLVGVSSLAGWSPLGLDDDYLPGARSHDEIRIVVDKAIGG